MALQYFTNVIKKHCTAFILSDFVDDKDFEKALLIANKKNDLVALQIYDRREQELPNVGLLKVRDAETDQELVVDSSSKEVRNMYNVAWKKQQYYLSQLFNRCRVDNVSINTEEDYVKSLLNLFRIRT